MFHDGAEDRRFDLLPFAVALGDRNEIRAVEHAADIRNVEQPRRQWRLAGGFFGRHVERTGIEHGLAGQEFQGCRIGGDFGLDEHFWLSLRVQGPWMAWTIHDRWPLRRRR